VPKTLLVVDDSATMRKVLEITFSGDEFRVVTAANAQSALARMSEEPRVVLIDTLIGTDDGYALCGEVRRRDPSVAILLLSSRHNPYDPAKGRDAGADDFMDKPFDTQQIVDKVKKALATRESSGASAAQAPSPSPAAQRPVPSPAAPLASQGGPHTQQGPGSFPPRPAIGAPAAAAPERARARTLMFGDRQGLGPGSGGEPELDSPFDKPSSEVSPASPAATLGQAKPSIAVYPPSRAQPTLQTGTPAVPMTPVAKPATSAPLQPSAAPATKLAPAAVPEPAAALLASGVNGHLASQLGELGLSSQQVDAVLALSRDVVEKVVWEVVPLLAETLIREEIARLTKE
jgi:CheY-like chemotaxis protein